MAKIKEIWKSLPYSSYYEVSNFGNARTTERPVKTKGNKIKMHKSKSVALTDNGNGYKLFGTKTDAGKKNFYIHRSVADIFIPNPNNLPQVNHKDGNKSNNGVDNLEWVTPEDNRKHAVENDLVCHGERSPFSRLTSTQVLEIVDIMRKNPTTNMTKLSEMYGPRNTNLVSRIMKGRRWRRITGINPKQL